MDEEYDEEVDEIPPQLQGTAQKIYDESGRSGDVNSATLTETFTDLRSDIIEFRNDLLGFEQDQSGVYKKISEPLLNLEGVNSVTSFIRTYSMKVFPLTKYSNGRPIVLTKYAMDVFAKSLAMNYKTWNVDLNYLDLITEKVGAFIEAQLSRAEGATTMQRLTSQTKISETHIRQQLDHDKGSFRLFGRAQDNIRQG